MGCYVVCGRCIIIIECLLFLFIRSFSYFMQLWQLYIIVLVTSIYLFNIQVIKEVSLMVICSGNSWPSALYQPPYKFWTVCTSQLLQLTNNLIVSITLNHKHAFFSGICSLTGLALLPNFLFLGNQHFVILFWSISV